MLSTSGNTGPSSNGTLPVVRRPLFTSRLGRQLGNLGSNDRGVDDGRPLACLDAGCVLGSVPSRYCLQFICGLLSVDAKPAKQQTAFAIGTHQRHPPKLHSRSRPDEPARP